MSEHPCSSQISKFIIRNTIHEISRGRRLERSGACCPRFFETSCACGSVSCRSDVIRCGLVPVPEYDHGFLSEAPLCRADLRFSKAHHPQHRHLPAHRHGTPRLQGPVVGSSAMPRQQATMEARTSSTSTWQMAAREALWPSRWISEGA